MNKKTITKLLAAMLAFTLTFANVAVLGINTQGVFAASTELENQNTAVDRANMEFDAYFMEEGKEKHSKEVNIAENMEKLYLKINLAEGYLANAKVKLQNANFKLVQTEEKIAYVESIDAENGIVKLNQINKEESVVIELPIKMNTDSNFDVKSLNRASDVVLEGKYVNTSSKERTISKTIQVNAYMNAQAKANLTSEVTKYVKFSKDEYKGVILQTSIKSNLENNILPVKQTELQIEIPKINGVAPTKVAVSATSTKATNGKDVKVFSSKDYKNEEGMITLTIENTASEEGIISWMKDVQDEILLTYIYDETALIDTASVAIKATSKITLYNDEKTVVTGNTNETVSLKETIGDIASFDVNTNTTNLDKGYMLVENADDTTYVDTWMANIAYKELVESVRLENETKYVDEQAKKYTSEQEYTYTKVDKENLVQMLGEEGYIKIYDKSGKELSTLNKDNLEYKYKEKTTYIKIETSKPQTEGILKIENGRSIKSAEYDREQTMLFKQVETTLKGTILYKSTELLKRDSVKTIELNDAKTSIHASINKTSLSTAETNKEVEMRIVLDTNDMSKSLYKNPNITLEFPSYVEGFTEGQMRGPLYDDELKLGTISTRRTEEGNIVVDIPFKGEQTKFNTSSVSDGATVIVYANLKVDELAPAITDNIKVYVTNENNTVYEDEEDGKGVSNIEINYAAPTKVITKNAINGYNGEKEEIKAIENEDTAIIDSNADAKTAKVTIDVVNSTSKDITNVSILGRIPFEGNKSITDKEDLGSTFTANMTRKIASTYGVDVSNVTVYYSSNGEATKDLTEVSTNGWTKDINDLSTVKSYLIVIKDTTLKVGDKVSFDYSIQIPEKLDPETEAYTTFAVYYNEVEGEQASNIQKVQEAYKLGLIAQGEKVNIPDAEPSDDGATGPVTTINKGDIQISEILTSSGKELGDNASIKEGQYIEHEVTMHNTTKDKTLTFDIEVAKENGTFYGLLNTSTSEFDETKFHTYEELTDEKLTSKITLKPDEEFTYKYEVIANKDTSGKELKTTVSFLQNGVKFTDDLLTNIPISDGQIKLNIANIAVEESKLQSQDRFDFRIYVENITDSELKNIVITLEMPDEIEYSSHSEYDGYLSSYTKDNNTLKFVIDKLDTGAKAQIVINSDINNFSTDKGSIPFEIMAKATVNNTEYSSNVYKNTIYQTRTDIEANVSGSILNKYITEGDQLTFTIDVENRGLVDEYDLAIENRLPDGLRMIDYTIVYPDGREETSKWNFSVLTLSQLELKSGEHITIKIKTEVIENLVINSVMTDTITIAGACFDTITKTITYNYQWKQDIPSIPDNPDNPSTPDNPDNPDNPNNPNNPDNPDNPDTPDNPNNPSTPDNPDDQTFSISGLIWNDANSDGRRDDDEKLLEGITVRLMNNQKSEFVKDSKGKVYEVITTSNGAYKFEGLQSGEYIVVFIYDTNIYGVTKYQASGVISSLNSDAIDGTIKIDGKDTKVAVTDLIGLGQSDKENVDLGLAVSKIFDLKLDKKVNTVIVQNAKGTKSYTFKDNKLGKVEIPAKNMVGSNITVEYVISVTNEGEVAGKVGRIVDYMPKDLNFSSEINNEWYQGTDGYLYTTELENDTLEPGETKKVTLVLTKVLKEAASEISYNTAEIDTSYNTLGIKDIDSTPGNNVQGEDDLSGAELIITIKTGALTYTLIILGLALLIGMLAGGIYLIKRKVLVTKI